MRRNEMLTRFYLLRNEIGQFMDMQGNPEFELSDNRWLCDFAFMSAKVKSFKTKLQLWIVKLQNNNTIHFPSLQE